MISPGLEGPPPAEVIGQILGGDAVEAAHPLLQAPVIGVDVVDVEVRRLGVGLAGRGQNMNADLGSPGEGAQGQAAIADQPVGGRDDALDRRPDRGGVHLRQYGVNRRAAAIARNEDGNVFAEEAGMLGLAAPLARRQGQDPSGAP